MKKVYIVLAMLFVSAIAVAQVNTNTKLVVNKDNLVKVALQNSNSAKTVNDTVGMNSYSFNLATGAFYYNPYTFFTAPATLGGFICSPDMITPQTFSAEGIIWRIYGKEAKAGSTLDSKIFLYCGQYNLTDSSQNYMTEDSITFADVDTASNGWNTKLFATPVAFDACVRPFVDIDFSAVMAAGDTIKGTILEGTYEDMDCVAMVSVSGDNTTWAYYYLSEPVYFQAWIIAENTTGMVGSEDFVSGMQLSQNYPNPSIDGTTTISYALNKAVDNVSVEVIDANGKVIENVNNGSQIAGTYTVALNTKLASGMYFYSLVADGMRLTKKMIVK